MRLIFSFVVFLLYSLCTASAEYCKLDTTACSCIAEDGWGVDLRNISGKPLSTLESGDGFVLSLCQDSKELPTRDYQSNTCDKGFSVSSSII